MDDYKFGFIFLVFGISTMRATPELEYGRVKIGSRPSTRKPPMDILLGPRQGSIYQFGLAFGAAFKHAIQKGIKNLHMFQEMNNQWPFSNNFL
ncbi:PHOSPHOENOLPYRUVATE CARBOXYLASE [Salix viminalis]|uniref:PHOSPHOENOLPYRUVATE CARBOXYLASE n=1 Tax=Salix viminalis TaxID=40686 RepID=A0A9Q0NS43_SALVM|nr:PHOSPHOENOLPYRUVATE CARBOXYLASE [Salix viminalis]